MRRQEQESGAERPEDQSPCLAPAKCHGAAWRDQRPEAALVTGKMNGLGRRAARRALCFRSHLPMPRKESDALREERAAILARGRTVDLAGRGAGLAGGDKARPGGPPRTCRRTPPPDGASRFVPLPEIAPPEARGSRTSRRRGRPAPWKAELEAIRAEAAGELFAWRPGPRPLRPPLRPGRHLPPRRDRTESPTTPRPAGCSASSRSKAAGRRLTPSGRSASGRPCTRLTVGSSRLGPPPRSRRTPRHEPAWRGREVWIPAEQADAERGDWDSAWEIDTEHFHDQDERAARRGDRLRPPLETLHQVFLSLFADVIGKDCRCPAVQEQGAGRRESRRAAQGLLLRHARTVRRPPPPRRPDIEREPRASTCPPSAGRAAAYFFRDRAARST